jgi:hypothetical protein
MGSMLKHLAAGLPILASLAAHAVYLNPLGPGQALLYPYYTARTSAGNAFNTYVSVANTGLDAVVAKVRFREGRNSRLVAEFNLYLWGGDMWTAALIPDGDGTRLVTRDRSCTNPAIPAEGLAFSNAAYAAGDDGAGIGLERTREGHLEVIEMATLSFPASGAINPSSPSLNCAAVQGAAPSLGALGAPAGALIGTATLINVASGLDASYVPDVLARLTSAAFYTAPGAAGTDFDSPQVDPVSAAIIGNVSYRLTWNRGIDAVNSVLMSELFENEFVMDTATRSKTDWVMTWPTRRLLVDGSSAQEPFHAPFPGPANFSCEGLGVESMTDRDAHAGGAVDFPERPPSQTRQCWSAAAFSVRATIEAIPAGNSDVLGASNTLGRPAGLTPTGSPGPGGVPVPSGVENGRMQVRYDGLGTLGSLPSSTWVDLRTGATGMGPVLVSGYPTIGFMVRTLQNGTLSCGSATCQGNYASAFPHRRVQRFFR